MGLRVKLPTIPSCLPFTGALGSLSSLGPVFRRTHARASAHQGTGKRPQDCKAAIASETAQARNFEGARAGAIALRATSPSLHFPCLQSKTRRTKQNLPLSKLIGKRRSHSSWPPLKGVLVQPPPTAGADWVYSTGRGFGKLLSATLRENRKHGFTLTEQPP
jgi:hypothetical protein